MAVEDVRRRSSYGPASPAIGERGARTRKAIIDSALRCFEEHGFEKTLVEDIASDAGISRATLYQYFENKEELFLELVRESGADLIRLIRRLRPLSESAEGFENLHWWLSDWAWVYDRYSTVFVQWSNVDSPKAPLRPMIAQFIESFTPRMATRVTDAHGAVGLRPRDMAIAILALLIRFNYYRRTGVDRGLSDDELLDALAVFLQMALFPSTAPAALAVQSDSRLAPPPRTSRGKQSKARRSARTRIEPRHLGAGKRAQATVRRLLDAGATVYAEHGFVRSSVEDVLGEAQVGRGTFYKYFRDKLEVLTLLAQECGDQLRELIQRFGDAADDPERLRTWLVEFVTLHQRYAGVLRAWTSKEPPDPAMQQIGEEVVLYMLETFDEVLRSVDRPYSFNVPASSLILLSLMERLPDYGSGTVYDMTTDRTVDVLANLIERGLLSRGELGARRSEPPLAELTETPAGS